MAKVRTIGQFAKEAGVSVETVRYYERQGLIDQPARVNGPRHYDDVTLAMVKYVRAAQGFGLSLREIKSLRAGLGEGRGFCVSLRALILAKLEVIQRERAKLEHRANAMQALLDRCAKRPAHLPCPVVEDLTRRERVTPAITRERMTMA